MGFSLYLAVIPYALFFISATKGSQNNGSGTCLPVKTCFQQLEASEKCRILPVPRQSRLSLVAPGTFRLSILRKGVWAYSDGFYLALIIKRKSRLVIVDFPDSPGSNKPDGSKTRITDAVEMVLNHTVPTRIDMVYTHAHYDHIGGATRFFNYVKNKFVSARVVIWGTRESVELVNDSVTKRAIKPNAIVGKTGHTLFLGRGLKLKMEIFRGHTTNDIMIYIPRFKKQKSIAVLVDIIFPKWAPPFNMADTFNLAKYILAHKKLLEFDFDIFFGGHLETGNRRDVQRNLEFSEDILKAAQTAVATVGNEQFNANGLGNYFDPKAIQFGNAWYVADTVVRGLQIEECFKIVMSKWGCRIGGVDISARGNCFTAITYVLLAH